MKRPVPRLRALALGTLLFAFAGCQDGQPGPEVAGPVEHEPSGLVASSRSASPSTTPTPTRSSAENGIEVIVTTENGVRTVKTTFEGGGDLAEIYPEAQNEIPGSGMRFPGWLTIIDADDFGSGNFANEPSPKTVAFWLIREGLPATSREVLFNDPVAGVSFFYSSSVPVTLEAFNASGGVVATAAGLANVDFESEPRGDPTGAFDTWDPLGVDAGENVITRVLITGDQNQSGFDDFTTTQRGTTQTVGPEGGTVTVEENGNTVAGTEIPPGTFNEDVNVTVRFEELNEGEQCHGTLVGQTGRCLEITAKTQSGEDAVLNNPVIVGACPPLGNKTGRGFYKFDDTGRPIALNEVDWDVITEQDCAGFASATGSSWLKGFASGLVNRVGRWLGPEPLRAVMFNRGYGHETPGGDTGFSHFTWASEIQVSNAGLAANVNNSRKDAFGVTGVFNLGGAAFSPTVHAVTVSFGDGGPALNAGGDDVVQTLSKTRCATSSSRNCWRLSSGWWVWFPPSGTSTGVLAMTIKNDLSGKFATGGLVPNTGLASGTPTFRAFALQIGARTEGVGLECDAQGRCRPHPDVHP